MSGSFLVDVFNFLEAKVRPEAHYFNGRTYTDRALHPVKEPSPETLELNSLTGVRDYINTIRAKDGYSEENELFISVADFNLVNAYAHLEPMFKTRHNPIRAEFKNYERFSGGKFSQTEFIVLLKTNFAPQGDYETLLKYVSHLSIEAEADLQDDGVSQTATIRTGIKSRENVKVPSPVTLYPFRSFPELDPLPIEFDFRLVRDSGCILKEVGSIWKSRYVARIKEWFESELKDTVISIIG